VKEKKITTKITMKRRRQKCVSSKRFHSTYIMMGHTDIREDLEIKYANKSNTINIILCFVDLASLYNLVNKIISSQPAFQKVTHKE
jgi:hypothetical protein